MLITKEFLKSLSPCTDGYRWWCKKYGESVGLDEFVKAADGKWDYVRWLSVRCLTHKNQVMFTVWCAEQVIHLYTGPSDAPQKSINAAKKWIEDPSEENRLAADAAAYAASAAYVASRAASAAAAYAASAAYVASRAASADAAYAANYAAYVASRAASADAAYTANYAASAAAAYAASAVAAYAASAVADADEYEDYKNFKQEAMKYLLTLEKIECK